MKHEAILAAYSNVVSVNGNDTNPTAYDVSGNIIAWDASVVAAKQTELENASKLTRLRNERNRLLAETDYLALSDNTLSTEMQTYRQALRDITDSYTSLDDVVWPTKP